jgi:DNA-binding HxlR family transcriptional regulator
VRPRRFDAKSGCAVGVTLSVIGGLWKPQILFHLFAGKKRFMELSRAIPNATQRMLTLQLRELEADGVIVRHAYPQVPPRVEYEISPFGQSLSPILLSLRRWGQHYEDSIEGTALQRHTTGVRQPNACSHT